MRMMSLACFHIPHCVVDLRVNELLVFDLKPVDDDDDDDSIRMTRIMRIMRIVRIVRIMRL